MNQKEAAHRQTALLQAAATAFEESIDPFSSAWLTEHEVTGEECFELGQLIASILKGYLAAPASRQVALLIGAIFEECGLDDLGSMLISRLQELEVHTSVRRVQEQNETSTE